MENNKKYCIYCGAENKPADKFCHKCGESFDYKDDELQTYAKDKIKDKVTGDVKDKATDSLLDMLKKFLNSKAYGIILSLSIVASATGMLVGGDGIRNFSEDVPGMFKDGTIYAWSFNHEDALFHAGVSGWAGYDENGVMDKIYLAGEAHFSQDINLKVTGANGKSLLKEKISYDENADSNRYCYVIKDLNATVETEIVPLTYENDSPEHYTVVLGTARGVKRFEEYNGDLLYTAQEYYENGEKEYDYWFSRTEMHPLTGNEVNAYSEAFYDENGRVVKSVSMIGDYIESKSTHTYTDDVVISLHTADNDSRKTAYYEKDSEDRILKEIHYDSDGSEMYAETFEYYPSGQLKAESDYGISGDDIDTLSYHKEYYENGNTKLVQHYYSGKLETETVYNENGTGTYTSYGYSVEDNQQYVWRYQEFVWEDQYNSQPTKELIMFNGSADVQYEVVYNIEDGTAVQTGYGLSYDGNGNTARHYEITYGPVRSVTNLKYSPTGNQYVGIANNTYVATYSVMYYDSGKVEREQYYDEAGNVTKVTVYNPDGSINTLQTKEY